MARTIDQKMQNIEISVIKSSVILIKVVNKLAYMEKEQYSKIGSIFNESNDSSSLLGYANRQIYLA